MPFSPQTADLLAFAGTYSLIVATPGPNLFVVVRASLSSRRHAGLAAAFGVAVGAGLLALLSAMLATAVVIAPTARPVAHVVFAALLIAMGWKAVASARGPADAKALPTPRSWGLANFGLGFATAATNPMSAVFFGIYLISGDWAGAIRPAPFEAALVAAGVAFLWFACVGTGPVELPPSGPPAPASQPDRRRPRHRPLRDRGVDPPAPLTVSARGPCRAA